MEADVILLCLLYAGYNKWQVPIEVQNDSFAYSTKSYKVFGLLDITLYWNNLQTKERDEFEKYHILVILQTNVIFISFHMMFEFFFF